MKTNYLSNKQYTELKKKAFPKGFERRFDKFIDSLNKKQYFEFMSLDEIRRNQIELLSNYVQRSIESAFQTKKDVDEIEKQVLEIHNKITLLL